MTNITWSYIFTFVGFLQMWKWAEKKHAKYISSYGDEYKNLNRKTIIPYLL